MILPPDPATRLHQRMARTADASAARRHFVDEVVHQLPLAQAVLSLAAYVLQPAFLDDLFARHRGRSYEDLLSFPGLVHIVLDALLQHHGSGRQALFQAEQDARLPTCKEAFYGKLRRIPLPLSLGFLSETSQRLRAVLPPVLAHPLPASLHDLEVLVLDGKKLKRVAKRLRACRRAAGKLSGGKLLVAWRPAEGLIVALAAHADGEANEARLVGELLPQVRAVILRRRLWVADRQFCDLVQTEHCTAHADHFLVRYHPKVHFHPDGQRGSQTSRDEQGRAVVEQWGWLGAAQHPGRRYVRRLTLERPGEEAVILVTDLLDASAYPAADLLAVYLLRWGIERVFQQITEVFTLEQWIGTTPQATVFQAAFCFVLYNLIQVVRGYVAQGRPEPCRLEQVSAERLFRDVQKQLGALDELATRAEIIATVPVAESVAALVALLEACLHGQWRPQWQKATNAKRRPQQANSKASGAHTSVYRLQEKERQQQSKGGAP